MGPRANTLMPAVRPLHGPVGCVPTARVLLSSRSQTCVSPRNTARASHGFCPWVQTGDMAPAHVFEVWGQLALPSATLSSVPSAGPVWNLPPLSPSLGAPCLAPLVVHCPGWLLSWVRGAVDDKSSPCDSFTARRRSLVCVRRCACLLCKTLPFACFVGNISIFRFERKAITSHVLFCSPGAE